MNMCGNIGGAISPALVAYLVRDYGWDVPFLLASVLCVIAALLFLRIDATRKIFVNPQTTTTEG
jgi:sugar phosphate permease